MNMSKRIVIMLMLLPLLSGCKRTATDENDNKKGVTEVTVTTVYSGYIQDNIELTGTTSYQKKVLVSAPISAFVTNTYVKIGSRIRTGQKLFEIESKEHQALAKMDTYSKLGKIIVRAQHSGVITSMEVQTGSYMMEGAVLCTFADVSSLVFNINVPYEDHRYMIPNGRCVIVLPDNTKLNARIGSSLLSAEDMSQVQPYIAKAQTKLLPEGMNVKVLIPKRNNAKCRQIIPKSALQSDETMQRFWIMKVTRNKAIKVPVTIGRSNQSEVEIVSPRISTSDVIVNNGAYALSDQASVKIVNKQ